MKINSMVFLAGTLLLSGCVSRLPWEDSWWGKRMQTYRSAKAVKIEYLDPTTWDPAKPQEGQVLVTVTNPNDLARLNAAMPISYMRKSLAVPDSRTDYKAPYFIVYYPTSGNINKTGEIYPATLVFVGPDGFVFHGRGNIVHANYHGLPLPKYLEAVEAIYAKLLSGYDTNE